MKQITCVHISFCITCSTVVLYIGIMGVRISCPKISRQNQLKIYLVISKKHRLGIAKLKKCLPITTDF